VPERFFEQLKVPSLQTAVAAPQGALCGPQPAGGGGGGGGGGSQSNPGHTQYCTPLCDEHVPERFFENDHVRSLQRAVAPGGFIGFNATFRIDVPLSGFVTDDAVYPAAAILMVYVRALSLTV
jgi:hypothetical protein